VEALASGIRERDHGAAERWACVCPLRRFHVPGIHFEHREVDVRVGTDDPTARSPLRGEDHFDLFVSAVPATEIVGRSQHPPGRHYHSRSRAPTPTETDDGRSNALGGVLDLIFKFLDICHFDVLLRTCN
jgi:hypothetical protein